MFKDSVACIRKFAKGDDEIQVMRNIGDIVCSGCVGDIVCSGCGMLGLWDVGDVGC